MFGGWLEKSRCPIGLDMGTHSIRLLQLEARPRGMAVVDAASAALSSDLPPSGDQRNDAIVQTLQKLLDEHKFIGRKVISCLPANQIQYKNLRLPKMPSDELMSAVEWEAADRLRLGTDQYQLQFYDAGEVRQGEEIREEVILLAAPLAAIDQHLQILTRCDLQPVAIDAVPGALSRCFAPPVEVDPDDPAQVVIDIGHTCTKVLIARNGRVVFFRLIDIGGSRLDASIAERLSLPLNEAAELRNHLRQRDDGQQSLSTGDEQRLFGSGRRENVERAVYESVRAIAGELGREIGLCLRYFSVTFRGKRPEHAMLVGGEATSTELAKIISTEAGIEVAQSDPLHGVDLSRVPHLSGELINSSVWAVAAGLSMRNLSRTAKRGAARGVAA